MLTKRQKKIGEEQCRKERRILPKRKLCRKERGNDAKKGGESNKKNR